MLKKASFFRAVAGFLASLFLAGPAQPKDVEEILYVQNPHGNGASEGLHVVWVPQPIQAICMDHTAQECSDIDYCIRITNRNTPTCQKLGAMLAHLPVYPRDMNPRRLLSVIYFPKGAAIPGLEKLERYFQSKPKGTFDCLTPIARFKAKVRLTRMPDDDQFELLEVLAAPAL